MNEEVIYMVMSTHMLAKSSQQYLRRFDRLPLEWKARMFQFLEEQNPELHYNNAVEFIHDNYKERKGVK